MTPPSGPLPRWSDDAPAALAVFDTEAPHELE